MLIFLLGAAPCAMAACTPPESFAKALRQASDAKGYAALGAWYAGRRQFGCAVEVFRKAAGIDPGSAEYQYLLGASLYQDGKANQAIAPLKRSLEIEPGQPGSRDRSDRAHQSLGAALDATGDRSAGELEWRLALAHDRASTVALEGLCRDLLADREYGEVITLLQPLAGAGTLTDQLAISLAAAYSSSGLAQQAAVLLQKRLEHNPASLELAEALSGVLILESRFQEAVAALSPVAGQHPLDLRAQTLLLQTLVLAHDPGAEALGQKLLASEPKQGELLYFLGMLHQQADDDAGARGFFERSIAARPGDPDTHYRLGVVLLALKQPAAAREQLGTALALGLDTPEVHVALAKALRTLGETALAQQQFDLYQQRLHAQAARAQAADKAQQGDQAAAAGNPQQTAEDYRAAFALDAQEPVLAYKLAMALEKTGDRAGERNALQQAVALDPRMAAAQNQLGYLDAGDNDTASAVRHFQLAVEADPAFTKAWLNLGATLCLQSKWSEARDALHHVLAIESDNSSAKALLERIDGMEAQAQR